MCHEYILDGTKIIREEFFCLEDSSVSPYTLDFLYDAFGDVTGFIYDNCYYYYQKNIQGDVIRILDRYGNSVTEYTYDTWGKVLSTSGSLASIIGEMNPFRYRSYYYDKETGLYYLNSRYYDPEVGRFLNPDGYVSTGQGLMGYNMFAYCNDNPVNLCDPNGSFADFIGVIVQQTRDAFGTMSVIGKKIISFFKEVITFACTIKDYFDPNNNVDIENIDSRLLLRLYMMGRRYGVEGIIITSGYRSYEKQAELYKAYLDGTGNLAAEPGKSWHNWGGAVDIDCQTLQDLSDEEFEKFGLIRPVVSESWHIQIIETQDLKASEDGRNYFNSIIKWSVYS